MHSGDRLIDVPLCDPEGLFFDGRGAVAAAPAPLAAPGSPAAVDAVFSVLQFGAIVPPLAPWSGVHRALPGYRYEGARLVGPSPAPHGPDRSQADLRSLDIVGQARLVEKVMDGVLLEALGDRRDPVVLFSGGVDSGFLASRLKAIGCGDALLLNYAFRDGDPESLLAAAMAKHLGLRFESIVASPTAHDPLESPGTVYRQPFADHSVVPTSEFALAVAERISPGSLVLDGTGADGGFGLGPRLRSFRRVLWAPHGLLDAARRFYQDRLWQSTGPVEKVLRVFSRAGQMPALSALLAQNPLAGSWYSAVPAADLHRRLAAWVEPIAGGSPSRRLVVADLALVCANVFAQKALPLLARAGCTVCYPFMSRPMTALAIEAIDAWPTNEAKAPLKYSLARSLPRAMVFRPKSGFADPAGEMFFSERFLRHLRSAAEDSSPLAGFIRTQRIQECCDLLRRRQRLPAQTLNTAWAITFTDRWYRTARPGLPGDGRDVSRG